MGGSDQWGNITTGTELIRRKAAGEAFALTCPLITKGDGTKFGKTEKGNIWLDKRYTSAYHFYQFWLNCTDQDSERYIKIFTLFSQQQIQDIIEQHNQAPNLRLLQKELARDITIRVHSQEDYDIAVEATGILFGKGTTDTLKKLPEDVFLSVFDGVPMHDIALNEVQEGMDIVELLSDKTGITKSRGEARRMLKEGSISINKTRVDETFSIDTTQLINNRYILVQRGKKNYFLINAS